MATNSKHPETLVLHSGYRSDPTTTAVAVPIYQTTSFQFHNTGHASNLFALAELGNIYSRIGNPSCDVLETRLAVLEGGVAGLALGSGQAGSGQAGRTSENRTGLPLHLGCPRRRSGAPCRQIALRP